MKIGTLAVILMLEKLVDISIMGWNATQIMCGLLIKETRNGLVNFLGTYADLKELH